MVVLATVLVVVVAAALLAEIWTRGWNLRFDRPAPAPHHATAGRPDPGGALVVALRRAPWARAALSVLSIVLLLSAAGLLGYPFYTDLYQGRVQERLDEQLASPEMKRRYQARSVTTGDSLTRIRIPSIGVDTVVVEGTTASALRAGAGHYPDTPLPCERGNVGIAGHRTTYGGPFADLDRLRPGEQIILDTPVGSCVYEVQKDPFIVKPTDMSVVAPSTDATLTLTTCHPKGSARERLIVRAVRTAGAAARS